MDELNQRSVDDWYGSEIAILCGNWLQDYIAFNDPQATDEMKDRAKDAASRFIKGAETLNVHRLRALAQLKQKENPV